jgi:hypothetical protein
MKIISKFLNNAPLILLHEMAVVLRVIRLGRRALDAMHLLPKELLHEGKLIETLVEAASVV